MKEELIVSIQHIFLDKTLIFKQLTCDKKATLMLGLTEAFLIQEILPLV